MTKKLQDKRQKLMELAINDDPSNQDIISIDKELSKDKFDFNTYSSRFVMRMESKNILVTGEYKDYQSILHFECSKCGHKWDGVATKVQQHGCPECYTFNSNLEKNIKLWDRSKKIIRDKGGKILQFPDVVIGKTPSLKDRFILSCSRDHSFTFTHLRLRDGQWCPLCRSKYGIKNEQESTYIYRRGMTEDQKFKKYCEIAEIKGVKILSIEPESKDFKVLCIHCNRTRLVTPRQLCNNQYLCENKCYKGNKYTLQRELI